jgi:hypothetical protein
MPSLMRFEETPTKHVLEGYEMCAPKTSRTENYKKISRREPGAVPKLFGRRTPGGRAFGRPVENIKGRSRVLPSTAFPD